VFLVPVGFFVASVVETAANRDGVGHLVVATAVPAAALGLQLLHSTRAAVRRRNPWWPWSLVAHGVVTYAPERGGVLTAEADGEGGFRLAVALPCASRDTAADGASDGS
jgi:hypothetical protein